MLELLLTSPLTLSGHARVEALLVAAEPACVSCARVDEALALGILTYIRRVLLQATTEEFLKQRKKQIH